MFNLCISFLNLIFVWIKLNMLADMAFYYDMIDIAFYYNMIDITYYYYNIVIVIKSKQYLLRDGRNLKNQKYFLSLDLVKSSEQI
jgi:hypothetical protein